MDERQTCWTSAVLWMVLGPPGANVNKTADLGSFMDGFGPRQNFRNNKTAGPQQFYGWFWAHHNKTAGPQQFYGWFWALRTPKDPMLSKLRTLAVLWMDLDTADLSSFMDGFGPSEIDLIKTADLGSSMDYFSLGRKTIQNLLVIVPYFLFCGISFPLQSSHRYTMYPIQKRFTCHIWQVFPSVGY